MSRQTSEMSLPTRQRTGEEEAPKERRVIGIDYGTTFTSVAYACIPAAGLPFAGARRPDIQTISTWPVKVGLAEVPTQTIYYNDENDDPKLEWGFGAQTLQVEARGLTACHTISLAKLLLHASQETDKETERIRRVAAEIPRTGKQLVEDFLFHLYDYLFREDARAPGHLWESEPDFMKSSKDSDIEFVIGVPAAWTEQEQIDMMAAAGRAGFRNASRVSEPEAVATEFFADEAYKSRLQANKTYVICDAGGGTVDFVTFTVESVHPLRIKERCVAEGVLCGSTFLNKRFKAALEKKLGGVENIQDIDAKIEEAVKEFDEKSKPTFNGAGLPHPFKIRGLGNDPEKGFRNECVWFSAAELCEQVFDEILDTIVMKIQRQIDESRRIATNENELDLQIEAIILAGGLSQNPYLKSKVRGHFERHPLPGQKPVSIQLRPSYNAIVARGLVHRVCLQDLVSQRRSKLNYGVRTQHPYEGAEVHGIWAEVKPIFDCCDRDHYIDTIEWFLPKDHAIIEGKEIVKERIQHFRLHEKLLLKDHIVWHDQVDTTERLTLWSNRPDGLTVVPFSMNLEEYRDDQFEVITNAKRIKYRKIMYSIVLRIDGSGLIWTLRVQLRDRVVEQSITTNLEAEVTQNRSIGSLAERHYEEVRRPLSDHPPEPMFSSKKRNIGRVEFDSNERGGRSVRPRNSPAAGGRRTEEGPEWRRSGRLRGRETEEAERRTRGIRQRQALVALRAGLDVGGVVESIERDRSRTLSPAVS